MNIKDLSKRADELIEQGEKVLLTKEVYDETEYIDSSSIKGFRSAVLSFIDRIYKKDHPHYTEFDSSTNGFYVENVNSGIAILKSIKDEIEGGWLITMKGLVTAEIFSDFIEMAEHLLSENYKDPAAVIIGSVLEEHLRQVCLKLGIEIEEEKHGKLIPKKADRLNADLVKSEAYSKLDQKAITTWLDLRNKAAHGKYSEYTKEQVELMMQGIIEFIARVTL